MAEFGYLTNKRAASITGMVPIVKQSGMSKGITFTNVGRGELRSL